ncbi:MAG: tyrosine-type recombinase/integrase [Chloroflexota bacterium]|nr:tyrosine-type recombinase/integrase [Chloroflexota bacterium]
MNAYMGPEEVERLEQAAAYLRDRLLIRLLFHLGCRISEALALEVKDVDLGGGTVTILHLKARVRLTCPKCNAALGRGHAFCPGCGVKVEGPVARQQETHRQRTLPVDSGTLEMLEEYIGRGGPVQRGERTLLFGINRHRAWQIVRECAEKAGLDPLVNPDTGSPRGVSPHRLRDAFAVHAMKQDDSGDALRLLQEHLGHQSFNTTARYRKVAGEEHREWYDRLWASKDSPGGDASPAS